MEKHSFSLINDRLSWYLSLIAHFTKLKPKSSAFVIVCISSAQILMIASVFIPLRMLFILGGNSFNPITLDPVLRHTIQTKYELAVVFAVIILLLTLLHMLIDKMTDSIIDKCASDIWKSTQKLQIYPDQEMAAANIYKQYIKGLAGFMLLGLSLIALYMLYPLLFFTFISYLGAILVGLSLVFDLSDRFKGVVEERLPKVLNTMFMFGFLVIFIVLAIDFTSGESANHISHAFISFILLRQAMGRVVPSVQSVKQLFTQRQKIIDIFFKKQSQLLLVQNNKDKRFWLLFKKGNINSWLPEAVNRILFAQHEICSIKWFEIGIPNEFAFIITTAGNRQLLFKIFHNQQNKKAANELIIVKNYIYKDLGLKFLGETTVEGFHCHLFELPEHSLADNGQFMEKKDELLKTFALVKLPKGLVQIYRSTHRLLHERFSQEVFDRVCIAADEHELQIVKQFAYEFENIAHYIKQLPLQLFIPGFSVQNTVIVEGRLKLLSAGLWSIEPLGMGFTTTHEQQLLKQLCSEDQENTIKMVNALKSCENNYRQHRFKGAIGNMKEVLSLMRDLHGVRLH